LKTVKKIVVCKEEHQDGGVHYHALLEFEDKLRTTNQRYFDFMDVHPNIQQPTNVKDVFEYITKEDDWINEGWFEESKTITSIVQEVATDTTLSHEQAVAKVIAEGGDKALRIFNQIDGYMKVIRKPSASHQPKQPMATFRMYMGTTWYDSIRKFQLDIELGCGPRGNRKSLWLHGPTRMGKTMLARSIGVHWYMNGMWNVDSFDDSAAYGVLDDIPWENMKGFFKGIMGLQQDVTVTDKYRRKSTIKHGKPCIMITNVLPDFTQEELEWLNENVNFCGVFAKCFYDEDEGFGQVMDLINSD